MTKKRPITDNRLFVLSPSGDFTEIEHISAHAEKLNCTVNALNLRRSLGRLGEQQVYVRGGYYFINGENKNEH